METPTIVEISLKLPLRRTFDYQISPQQQVDPGCRVIVPFRGRLLSGVVVGVKTHSQLPAHRLKAVHRLVEGRVLFSEEMLRLTRWIGSYYFCGWGEALDSALPSGLGVKIQVRIKAREPLPEAALKALSPPLRAFVRSHQEWDEGRWKQAGPTEEDQRWLTRQCGAGGLLLLTQVYAGMRNRTPLQKWVRPAATLPAPLPTRRNARRETRREKVLRLLREEGALPMARLKATISAPQTVVRALAAEGWVEIVEKPAPSRFRRPTEREPFLELNPEQRQAYAPLAEALRQGSYRGFLLEGVTGSGKTEVYLHAVQEALRLEKNCLVLVPEIALTESIVNRFRARFGDAVAVLHSGMGEGERFDEWRRVHQGEARIVIGARSAVFAPLQNLGLVVVDEEHDGSYKQDEAPRYHGRDVAIMRAHQVGAVVVLGSATPSLEASHNVSLGKLERLCLLSRAQQRPLPQVELLDLKTQPRQQGSPLFTRYLADALREVLLRGEQAMVFLNRRGFAHLVHCNSCKTVLVCDHCSISLTYHAAAKRLRCHRCDFSRPLPTSCPHCHAPALEVLGLGTERIEQELGLMFPQARILRMDGDTLRRKGELERMLTGIQRREYDLIIGTQVLSKGHDFPHITLVGAILADVSLNLPDFRAAERTFQLLTQMAGRAGRGSLPGRVLIQTYNPGHYSLAAVQHHDVQGFIQRELELRSGAELPPFCSQALLWISGPQENRVEVLVSELAERLRAGAGRTVQVLGPAPGGILRIKDRFRWMILLKSQSISPIHALLQQVLEAPGLRVGAKERITVDVDPYHLL